MKGELLRGKFKIPFYSNKIKPEALVDELKGLKAVGSTLLFLRVSFPQDTEYGYEEIAEPKKIQVTQIYMLLFKFICLILHQSTFYPILSSFFYLNYFLNFNSLSSLPRMNTSFPLSIAAPFSNRIPLLLLPPPPAFGFQNQQISPNTFSLLLPPQTRTSKSNPFLSLI